MTMPTSHEEDDIFHSVTMTEETCVAFIFIVLLKLEIFID